MTKARVNADNASADIQGVTAGTGLSGGGTSGTVTLTNDMATVIDAKGDLVVGTGADTYDNLAAGSNGETLVADSSATTGLSYQANFAAGKNKIINGDFRINQRAFTSTTTSGAYGHDRFWLFTAGGTTYSNQTFTLGTAPVTGYEAINFAQLVTTSQNATTAYSIISQKIESVRTLANQTATISFWAKAASGTPKVAIEIAQDFGTGGSPSASVNTAVSAVTLSTSWARYSVTVNVPSISGKTIGNNNNDALIIYLWVSAGTNFASRGSSIGAQDNTFDIWGVQVEAGSVATAFQTATGTIQGELAAAQRYYQRIQGNATNLYAAFGSGFTNTTTNGKIVMPLVSTMRVTPTSLDYSNLRLNDSSAAVAVTTLTIDADSSTQFLIQLNAVTTSTLTANRPAILQGNNSASANVGLSAEL
jgi:hypothetical protein